MVPKHRPTQRQGKLGFISAAWLLAKASHCKNLNWSCSLYDWSKLPDDLWVEILCRIPEKELVRCRKVCKSWNDLITNACVPKSFVSAPLCGFIYNIVKHKFEPFMGYMCYGPVDYFVGFVFACSRLLPFASSSMDFLGYCNGLLLFSRGSSQQYYVCNPATQQCVAIPICSEAPNFNVSSLAFDPCRSQHFRLVCSCYVCPNITFYIFSSERCRWDIHEVPFEHPAMRHSRCKRSMYLNGVLYQLSESKHLICLDIDRINACAIDLPEKERTDFVGFIGESRRHLYYANRDCNDMFIWMLEGYCEDGRWILMHKICIRDLVASPLAGNMRDYLRSEYFMPYAVHPTSNIIFIGTPKMVATYNPSTCKLKCEWRMKRSERIADGQFTVWPYRRCLVNLKSFD